MHRVLSGFLLLISFHAAAQKITGIVKDSDGNALPYASVTIKGTSIGASANNKAHFSFNVSPGRYIVVCQHVGYAKEEKSITLATGQEVNLEFVLAPQKLEMAAVVVRSNAEDPAYAIIRQAIKKRPFYAKQVNGFRCDLYTKDILKLRSLPNKILGRKIPDQDRRDMMLDSSGKGIIYLGESVAKVYIQQPDKFKMEVISSRVSGNDGFGFTFPAFISLYNNNVNVFDNRLNPRGFISPIADAALGMYKYKFLGSFFEDGKEINSIQVIPRRTYEPLFSGVLNITDGDWRIHSFDLLLTKQSQLELMDSLQITQIHVPVGNDIWRVKNQLLHFNFKQFGIDAIGNFLSVYTDYQINPVFDKKLFDRVVIKYDTAVNKKTRAYWDTVRPVPLEPEEKKDYHIKDSLFEAQKDSLLSQSNIDTLKKRQGPLKPLHILWKGIERTRYSRTNQYSWGIESLGKGLEYNTAEGLVLNVNAHFDKHIQKWKTNFSFEPNLRYGFSNTHLNAWVNIIFRTRDWDTDKKIKRQTWYFSGGKRVSQFNNHNPINALSNTVNTLIWGDNYMKTYENYYGAFSFSKRFESGLRFSVNLLYEDRIPLNNTTDFIIFTSKKENLTPNYPYERIPAQFTRHQAFIIGADISFKPGQRYIQFPNRKTSLGSKYPTFSLSYRKGIEGLLGSDVNFDKWLFDVSDTKNLKIAGTLKFKVGMGGFLNSRKVFIQDYHHFNGNRTMAASEYLNSFQLAPYYLNSTAAPFFAFGHIEHHFNGMITNKIPLFKRLNWNLVVGSNAFYVNSGSNYAEIFGGIENILKIFRVDLVAGYANGNKTLASVRIGASGILGNTFKDNAPRRRAGGGLMIGF